MDLTLKKIHTSNVELKRITDLINDNLAMIGGIQIINGVKILNQTITAGVDNVVSHGLGRTPNGIIVIGNSTANYPYESSTANENRNRYLLMRAGSTTTASFWVF